MQYSFVLCFLVCAYAAPPVDVVPLEKQQPTVIPIVSQSEELEPNGTYKFSYETGNGIKREETSYDKIIPKARGRSSTSDEGGESSSSESDEIHVQQGSYSYTAPDGTLISVRYIADENGFQPIGDHIPRVPDLGNSVSSPNEKRGRALKVKNVKNNAGLASNPIVVAELPSDDESESDRDISKQEAAQFSFDETEKGASSVTAESATIKITNTTPKYTSVRSSTETTVASERFSSATTDIDKSTTSALESSTTEIPATAERSTTAYTSDSESSTTAKENSSTGFTTISEGSSTETASESSTTGVSSASESSTTEVASTESSHGSTTEASSSPETSESITTVSASSTTVSESSTTGVSSNSESSTTEEASNETSQGSTTEASSSSLDSSTTVLPTSAEASESTTIITASSSEASLPSSTEISTESSSTEVPPLNAS